ncbi:hypothetical protein COBT_000528 [Conglomerata obtusa]
MRKITDYLNPKSPKIETQNVKTLDIRKKLPPELFHVLSKYNYNFSFSTKRVSFFPKKTSTAKIHKKHVETYLYYKDKLEPKLICACLPNLRTYEVIDAKVFDFTYLINSNIKSIKLINIGKIIIINNNFNIKAFKFENCILDINTIKLILTFPKVYKLKIVNCMFVNIEGDRNITKYIEDIFILIKENNKIKHFIFESKYLVQKFVYMLDLNKFDSFAFTNSTFKLACKKSATSKNCLILKNCHVHSFNYDFSEIFNLEVQNENDISLYLDSFVIGELESLKLINCVVSETVLTKFILRHENLRYIDISRTYVSLQFLELLIFTFKQTLRYLNVSGLHITSGILLKAKNTLKNCKIIYNNDISFFIK